jgi:hypothetical protein
MSWVYFARREDNGLIKIGCSCDVAARMYTLGNEVRATIKLLARAPGDYAEEARMHQRFIWDRTEGEWFQPTKALHQLIRMVRKTGCLPKHPVQTKHQGFERIGDAFVPVFSIAAPARESVAA